MQFKRQGAVTSTDSSLPQDSTTDSLTSTDITTSITSSTTSSTTTSSTSTSTSSTSTSSTTSQSTSTTHTTSTTSTTSTSTSTSQTNNDTSSTTSSTSSQVSSSSSAEASQAPTSSNNTPDLTPASSPESTITPTTTANYTTIVTNVGGISTTIVSQLPTSLVASSQTDSNSSRTATIAGATTGVFVLIVVALTMVFVYRKHKLRRDQMSSGKKREGHGLLDGEDFDDYDTPLSMRQTSSYAQSFSRPSSPAPSLLKSRVTGTGSIFREEIWPPPGFVDPISKNNSQVNLGGIVDDVMGPAPSAHARDLTDASTSSNLSASTATTVTPLLAGQQNYDDPFSGSASQASFYGPTSYFLPPGASPPMQPGMPNVMSPSSEASSQLYGSGNSLNSMSTSHSASVVPTQGTLLPPRSVSTVPKKSSPLARALTSNQKQHTSQDPLELLGSSS